MMDDEREGQVRIDRSVTPNKNASGHRPSSIVHRPIEGEDFYREGAMIVFTALYHLRRGYCCGSGCRHCPYDAMESRRYEEHEADSI
ncbi:MAG TPA: DUF5522 domain-containing protein [Pyrinomonadaceae bacterium]|jgi:hypothetical protein